MCAVWGRLLAGLREKSRFWVLGFGGSIFGSIVFGSIFGLMSLCLFLVSCLGDFEICPRRIYTHGPS